MKALKLSRERSDTDVLTESVTTALTSDRVEDISRFRLEFLDTDEGHEWSESTGRAMAHQLISTAKALLTTPIPPMEEE